MNDLNHLVRKYSMEQEHKIKKICSPIQEYLNISEIGYARIEADGRFCNISSFPAFLEYFFAERLYEIFPFFKHPNLFQSGYTVIPVTSNPFFQKKIRQQYGLKDILCKIQKDADCLELFFFHPVISLNNQKSNSFLKYLSNVYLLDKFAKFFKKEAHKIIESAMNDGYNMQKMKGQSFYEATPNLGLLRDDLKLQQFLKKISPLTEREQQCLDLYKQGRSSQATAAILNLSQRTVEHYFDNIKTKLGCQSKMELLEW